MKNKNAFMLISKPTPLGVGGLDDVLFDLIKHAVHEENKELLFQALNRLFRLQRIGMQYSEELFHHINRYITRSLNLEIDSRELRHELYDYMSLCIKDNIMQYGHYLLKRIDFNSQNKLNVKNNMIINISLFNQIVYTCLELGMYSTLKDVLNNLQQIKSYEYRFSFETELRFQKVSKERKEEIENILKYHFYVDYLRIVSKIILFSWSYLLNDKKKISDPDCLDFVKALELEGTESNQQFIDIYEDLVYRMQLTQLLGVEYWDYEPRPTGKIYSPPSPHDWIKRGLFKLVLDGTINLTESREVDPKPSTRYLKDDFSEFLTSLVLDEESKNKVERILRIFDLFISELNYREIKELSQKRLNNDSVVGFIERARQRYFDFSLPIRIAQDFNLIQYKEANEVRPVHQINLPKGKLMFIDNGQNNLGLEDTFIPDARYGSSQFVKKMVNLNRTYYSSVSSCFEDLLNRFSGMDYDEMAFIAINSRISIWEEISRNEKFREDFIPNYKDNLSAGKYRNIPVYDFMGQDENPVEIYLLNVRKSLIATINIYQNNDKLPIEINITETKMLSNEDIEQISFDEIETLNEASSITILYTHHFSIDFVSDEYIHVGVIDSRSS